MSVGSIDTHSNVERLKEAFQGNHKCREEGVAHGQLLPDERIRNADARVKACRVHGDVMRVNACKHDAAVEKSA